MSSIITGASREASASRRHRTSQWAAEPGRPDLRWRYRGNPLGRVLLHVFFAAARQLILWQRRIRDRDTLRRLPDHILRDIGLDPHDLREEADKPFWRA